MTTRGFTTVDSILNPVPQSLQPIDGESLIIIRDEMARLSDRIPAMNKYRDYYSGEQTLVFGTTQFQTEFGTIFKGFKDNWTKVVVDAIANRLEIEGFAITEELADDSDTEANDKEELARLIWTVLARNKFNEQQDDLWNGALVEGRSSLIIWPDASRGGARLDWNPGQNVIVRWDDDHTKIMWAVKTWRTPSGATRVNLYRPDRLEKYRDNSTSQRESNPNATPREEIINTGQSWAGLQLFETVTNSLNEVPVVEFVNREGSEIRDTIAQQDALNYIIVSSLIGAGLAGYPQRVMMTNVAAPEGGWQNHPGRVWKLPHSYDPDGNPIESKIGEFRAADLDKFVNLTQEMLRHVAATSSTPMRFFYQSDRGGRGDASSGEALRVDDEPLIDKVDKKQDRFGNAAYEAFRLIAKASKIHTGKTFPIGHPYWRDAQARHRTILLQDALAMKELGLPFEYIVEQIGLSPLEIKRVMSLREDELKEQADQMQQQLEAEAKAAGSNGANPTPASTRPTAPPRAPSQPPR